MKTTKKHFAIFKAECERLIRTWKLTGWRFEFRHIPLQDGLNAQCSALLEQRAIALYLNTNWHSTPTPTWLRYWARHETIHALVAPLDCICSSRWVCEDEYLTATHEVLERLMRLLPK